MMNNKLKTGLNLLAVVFILLAATSAQAQNYDEPANLAALRVFWQQGEGYPQLPSKRSSRSNDETTSVLKRNPCNAFQVEFSANGQPISGEKIKSSFAENDSSKPGYFVCVFSARDLVIPSAAYGEKGARVHAVVKLKPDAVWVDKNGDSTPSQRPKIVSTYCSNNPACGGDFILAPSGGPGNPFTGSIEFEAQFFTKIYAPNVVQKQKKRFPF